MLYGHGDDTTACKQPLEGNFSSNVWYEGYVHRIKDVVLSALDKVTGYPEPDAHSLRVAIAETYGVGAENVLVSSGAIEAIYLIAQAWSEASSLVVTPTFSEYEDACTLHKHRLSFVSESDFCTKLPNNTELVWLCNPNNPTGKVRKRAELLALLEANPNVLFIIDQSYASFYGDELLHPSDTIKYGNLMLICSLTKCYAIPGIRVGYAVSSPKNINRIMSSRIPWSVNTIAVEVAKYFIANRKAYRLPLNKWLEQKRWLCENLEAVSGVEVLPSETPYFLMRLHKGTSAALKQYLINEHRLLIRDAANFRGLNEQYVRIAPQSDVENEKLIKALKQWSTINQQQ